MFSEVGKALSKCIPDLVLDCIRRDSPIDQDDASRFVFGQLSIGANQALAEFIRLFLHSIANFFSIPKTRLSSGPIDVEHEGKMEKRNRQRQRYSVFRRAQDRVDAPHLGKPWLNQKSDRKLPIRRAAVPAGFSHARVGCGSLQKEAVQFQASWHDCLQNAGANAEWLRQSRCRRAPEELPA